jgi:hypothetical protein
MIFSINKPGNIDQITFRFYFILWSFVIGKLFMNVLKVFF